MIARKLISLGLAAVLLLNPLVVSASNCEKPPLVSAFANGIQNTREEAIKSQEKLMVKAGDLGFKDKVLLYHVKGRIEGEPGHLSFALDMFEVFALLSKESVGSDPQLENQALAVYHGQRRADAQPGTFYTKMVAFYEQARNDIEAKAFKVSTPDNLKLTVVADVAVLTSRLKAGETIMLAAHSQGTLWANAVMAQVEFESPSLARKVRVAYAGVAASKVWQTPGSAQPNSYVTNENDLVIGALRPLATVLGLPAPLGANAAHPRTMEEPLGHGFEQIYLNESAPTGAAFLSLFRAGIRQLRDEQGLELIASMEVSYGISTAGTQHLNGLGISLSNGDGGASPTLDETGGYSATYTFRKDPSTLTTRTWWYCHPEKGSPAGTRLALAVELPDFYGPPLLLEGNVTFKGVAYPIQRIGEGVYRPPFGDFAWQIGSITYVNSAAGVVPKLELL